ncbi:MAG TPA: DUF4129 domain-containing protein [Thermoplasmata archaeon]|jgi:Domain of unknown function (DUF4129)|nr:DUF4129 domain-containing protein [Thermoplasmata archaeon]
MRRRDQSGRVSPSIVALVLIALAVGGAASLLSAAAPSNATGSSHYAEIIFPLWVIEAVTLGLIALGLGFLFYQRARGGSPLPNRVAVTAIVAILVAVLVLFAFQSLAHNAGPSSGGNLPPPPPVTSAANATNGTTNSTVVPGSGSFLLLGPNAPPWGMFALLGAIGLVVSVLVTSPVWMRALGRGRERDRGDPSAAEVAAVKDALDDASRALDAGGDPRTIVIRLYAAILVRIGPSVGDVDRSTPEEIRAIHLVRLGIRATAAEQLTRSFEEARYSSHPVSPQMVERVTTALREASEDLDRLR